MAKFYINFRNGDHVSIDDEGIDVPDIEAARDWAIKSARELIAEAIKYDGDIMPNAVIITDEGGKDLMTIAVKDALPESLRK